MKRFGVLALAFLSLAIMCPSLMAEEHELALKRRGLVLQGSTWVVHFEKEIDLQVLKLRKAYAELRKAESKARAFDSKNRHISLQIAAWKREMETAFDRFEVRTHG